MKTNTKYVIDRPSNSSRIEPFIKKIIKTNFSNNLLLTTVYLNLKTERYLKSDGALP